MNATTHFDEQRHRLIQESDGLGLEVQKAFDVLDAMTNETRVVFDTKQHTVRALLELLYNRRSSPTTADPLHALIHPEFAFQSHMQSSLRQTISNAGMDTLKLIHDTLNTYRTAMRLYGRDSNTTPPIEIGFSIPTYRARESTTKTYLWSEFSKAGNLTGIISAEAFALLAERQHANFLRPIRIHGAAFGCCPDHFAEQFLLARDYGAFVDGGQLDEEAMKATNELGWALGATGALVRHGVVRGTQIDCQGMYEELETKPHRHTQIKSMYRRNDVESVVLPQLTAEKLKSAYEHSITS